MFLKGKICLTLLTLYEIVAVIILHSSRFCAGIFSGAFCEDHIFKYFIICFAVPALIILFMMWVMEIIDSIRHRHSLMYRAKMAIKDIASDVEHKITDNFSIKDLEKMIIGAVLLGIKKYASFHPEIRNKFNDMTDNHFTEYSYNSDDTDEDADEDEDEEDNYDRAYWNRDTNTSSAKSRISNITRRRTTAPRNRK